MSDRVTVEEADVFGFLRQIPDSSVNLVLTDPTYPGLDAHRAVGTTTRLQGGWFPTLPHEDAPRLFKELFRVLARGSHLYAFADEEAAIIYRAAAQAAGFRHRRMLVWDKMAIGMGYSYRSAHEFIVYVEKGPTRKLSDLGVGSILRFKRLRGDQYYPTEKPVDLLSLLIRQSSVGGDLVLDPFCGSGAVGEAALRAGRRFMGADLSRDAVERARRRCNAIAQEENTEEGRAEEGRADEEGDEEGGSSDPPV